MKPDPTKLYGITHRLDGTPIIRPGPPLEWLELLSGEALQKDRDALRKANARRNDLDRAIEHRLGGNEHSIGEVPWDAKACAAWSAMQIKVAVEYLSNWYNLWRTQLNNDGPRLQRVMLRQLKWVASEWDLTLDECESVWKQLPCVPVDREELFRAFKQRYPDKRAQTNMLKNAGVHTSDFWKWLRYEKFENDDSKVSKRIVNALDEWIAAADSH